MNEEANHWIEDACRSLETGWKPVLPYDITNSLLNCGRIFASIEPMQACFRSGLMAVLLWQGWAASVCPAAGGSADLGVSPSGGIFASNVTVVITSSLPIVRFTLDGSTVTTNAPPYTAPVLISNSCLLLARGFSSNGVAGEMVAEGFSLLDTNFPDFKSTLPLVVIDTFGRVITSGTNIGAAVRVMDTGTNGVAALRGATDFAGRAGVKLRGYSSLRYPKKSLALETRDEAGEEMKAALLGFPKESDWVLYAPYMDKSLLRDVLAYEWSNRMGHYASRTRFVEVFVNETTNRLARSHYAGVYVLEEKMKRGDHRVNIHKLAPVNNTEPEISGGYIFKKDHLDEVEGKEAAVAALATAPPAAPTRIPRGWHRSGFPTGLGGFPADPAGLEAVWFEPPETNSVIVTNVVAVTNVAWFTNLFPVTTVAVTTNIHAVRTFTWTTNVLPVTNVTMLTNVFTGTNVVSLTNVATVTNVAAVPNVAPFTGQVMFTNRVSFTNVALFTNVTVTTNIASLTNVTLTTNVTTLAAVGSKTNLVPSTNVTTVAGVLAVTNIAWFTNLTVATTVDLPVPPSPVARPAPLLSVLVNSGQGFVSSRTNAFFFVEPKHERITAEQRAWLSNFVNRFEAALYGPDFRNPTNGYAAFIDADSFIDHHLIVETTKNIDGYRFSTFFTKDRGGKLKMEPIWDWNLALGNAKGRDGHLPEYWYWPQLDDKQYSWFRQLFEDPDFAQRYVDRWAELRTNVLVTSNLLARVDQLAALLQEPAARNFERWPILGTTAGMEYPTFKTWPEEVAYLKDWIAKRLAWINAQFIPPPALAVAESAVAGGSPLSLTGAVGRIYFTLDGSDPRAPGGTVSASAQAYQLPVRLNGEARLVARVQNETRWSSPLRARLVIKPSESGN
jgi:hypothetical protein